MGFGTGMIQPQIAAFLGEMRPKYRATMIETGLFALFLGLAVAPLIFNHFSTPTTFDIPFLISGASGVVLMLLTVFIVPSKYRTKMNPIRGLLKNIGKPLILAALSYLALGIAFFAYQSYYTPYLIANGISEATASIIVSLFGFAGIALAYPGGLAGDRFNRKYVILLAIILFLIGGVIMFEAPVTIGIMAFGVILFGAGYVIYGNIQAYAQESVESAWASSSNGFILAIFNIGSATGGPLMGTLIVLYGYHLAAIGAVVVPLLVSIGLMGFAPRLKKRTEISQAITEKASGKR